MGDDVTKENEGLTGNETEEQLQEEYDKAWEEGEKKKPDRSPEDKGLEGDEDGKEPPDDGLPPGGKEEARDEGDDHDPAKKKEEPVSKDHGDFEAVEKALKDTKAHATKLAQENAQLKELLVKKDQGKATDQDVADQKKAVKEALTKFKEEAAKTEEDYPELKSTFEVMHQVLDTLISKTEEIEKKTEQERADDQRREALAEFNTKIKPKVLETHKDYDEILGIKPDGSVDPGKLEDYVKWAEGQRPGIRMAALNSNDPDDIVFAITEYKKHLAKPGVEGQRATEEKKQKEKIVNSQTLRGGSRNYPGLKREGGANKDPEDYDDGWEDAGRLLKQQAGARGT